MDSVHDYADALRALARRFTGLNERIQDGILPEIADYISSLRHRWDGVSRHQYEQLFRKWSADVERIMLLGEELSAHLCETAERFEQNASRPVESQ